MSFLKGSPPKVVWLSAGNADTDVIAQMLSDNREHIAAFISAPEESSLVPGLPEEKSLA